MPSQPSRFSVAMRLVLSVAIAFLTLPFLNVGAAYGAPTSIQVDGNQDGAGDDWQGYAVGDAGFSVIRDGISPADTTGIDGQERDYDGVAPEKPWAENKSTASKKSDIGNVLVSSYRSGGDLFAAIGLDRGGDTGTQRYYFELNQQAHSSLMPPRTKGDIRAVVGINGSSIEECKGAQIWDGQWGALNNLGVFVPGATASCAGVMSFDVNDGPIADYFQSPHAVGGNLPANQFFELSIDLTRLGATSCPVTGFRTFNMRTQEGNENGDTGQLKDVIQGSIDIPSDCATIKIVKKDFATGAPVTVAGTVFSIAPNPTPGAADQSAKTVVDNNTSAAALQDADPAVGAITVTNVKPGVDYTITEVTAPGGYLLPPPGCDDADDTDRCTEKFVGSGQTQTWSFKDKRRYDAPTVVKDVRARFGTAYTWTIDKGVRVATGGDPATGGYSGSASQDVAQAPTPPTTGSFDYKVTASVTRQTSNYVVSGTVKVLNPNDRAMVVMLSDQLSVGASCTFPGADEQPGADGVQVTVPANAGQNQPGYAYTCTPGNHADGTNTATVTWDRSVYPQGQADVDAADPGDGSASTDAVPYSFQANQPEVNRTATITDDHHTWSPAWTMTWTDGGPATQSETRYYTRAVTGKPGQCLTETNTATVDVAQGTDPTDSADAEVCVGADLDVEKVAVGHLTRSYPYTVEKRVVGPTRVDADSTGTVTVPYEVVVTDGDCSLVDGQKVCSSYTDSDWSMDGSITIHNPNSWPVTLDSVSDEYAGIDGACDIDQTGPFTVPAGAVNQQGTVDEGLLVLDYTCVFDTKPPYDAKNVATITWDAAEHFTPHGTDSGDYQVTDADWRETPVNKTVRVIDDKTVAGQVHDLGTLTWVGAGHEHAAMTYTVELRGTAGECVPYTNTAKVIADTLPYEDATVLDSDTADVLVCWQSDLTVSKDGDGTFERDYQWLIDKVVVDAEGNEVSDPVHADGPGHTFDYRVRVSPNGYDDSGWVVTGDITVSNPNSSAVAESIEVDVTDVPDMGAGATCTVTDGENRAVPADGSITVGYTCTVPNPKDTGDDDTYAGNANRALATWAGGSAWSDIEPIGFTLPPANETDRVIDVTDAFAGGTGNPVPGLQDVDWLDGATSVTYERTVQGVPGECTTYDNVATIVQTEQTDNASATLCVQRKLTITNQVETSFDRTYKWVVDKAADKHEAEVSGSDTAPFVYTVTAGPQLQDGQGVHVDSGWTMTGTVTVTNPNSDEIDPIGIAVTDVTDVGGTCAFTSAAEVTATLAAGETVELSYTCDLDSPPDYTGTNTARVDWGGAEDPMHATAVADVVFADPTEHDRYVDVLDAFDGGTGEPIEDLQHLDWFDGAATASYTRRLGSEPGTCTTYPNVASVYPALETSFLLVAPRVALDSDDESVKVCAEAPLALDKTVLATYERTYHWRLDKVAAQLDDVEVTTGDTATFDYTVKATPVAAEDGGYTDDSFAMSGTISVTNPNSYEGGSITAEVTDVPSVGDVTCEVEGGAAVTLEPGQTKVLPYDCAITGTPDYTGSNQAVATWTGPGDEARTATSDSDPETQGDQQEPVTFALVKEIDKTVTVLDDKTRPGQPVELGTATWNPAGTPTTFTYQLPLTGQSGRCTDFVNTATVPLDGSPDLSDTATVTLCVEGDALLANIVNASYDRSYAWSIGKAADGTSFSAGDQGTATVSYQVDATPGAATDSGWTMGGALTVSNPNEYKSLAVGVSTLTTLGAGTTCALTPGQDLVVPAKSSRTYTYACTFTGQPAYTGTDSTTVTWDKGSVKIDTPVAFALDQETNKTVDLVDDQTVPGRAVPLGSVTWNDTGAPTTFSYDLDLAAAVNECEEYTNTASIVQTSQTAAETVEVCGPQVLPAEAVRPPAAPRPPTAPLPPVVVNGVPSLPGTGGPEGLLLWSGIGLVLAGGAVLLARGRKLGA